MADIDNIMVCERCLHPVEGSTACPKCGIGVKTMPVLLLQSLRYLRVKGWIMERWESAISIPPAKEGFTIQLWFHMFAPSTHYATFGVGPVFDNMKPSYMITGGNYVEAYQTLHKWAYEVKPFSIPFGQGLCDKCVSQGADWYFCRVNCTNLNNLGVRTSNKFTSFDAGLPNQCVNLVLQTMTMPERLKELESLGFFDKNPIARRTCMRMMR